ncbi:unnamed protein product [Umbelopsis ramanniana]
MSNLALLERQLKDINDFTYDSKIIAVEIAGLALDDIAEKDLDFATALIFDHEYGVLRYLCTAIDYNRVDTNASAAKVALLEFIARYIERIKSSAQPYVRYIKKCVLQMMEDKSLRVKTAAFEPLLSLIDPANKVDVTELDLRQIVSKFSTDFTMSSATVKPAVKGQILHLLGGIARYQPSVLNDGNIKSFLRWSITTVTHQLFQEKNADTSLITGAVRGLDNYLFQFYNIIQQNPNDIDSLYRCVKSLLEVPEELLRYSAPLATMDFLTNHFGLFHEHLIEDCKFFYIHLVNLSSHRNRDMSKAGIHAVHKLLDIVSDTLAKSTAGPTEKKCFAFLFRTFVLSLNQYHSEQDDQSISVAIYGIGYLAQSCTTYLTTDEFDQLLQLVLKRSTWLFSVTNESETLGKDQLTPIIQTLARIVAAMKTLDPTVEAELLRATDFFFTYYTRIGPYSRRLVVVAIKEMLYTIGSIGEELLRKFCHEAFFTALVRTVSGIGAAAITTLDARHQDWIEFRYVWEQLLQEPNEAEIRDMMDVDSDKLPISTVLYDELMSTNIVFLNTLDLGTIEYDQLGDTDTSTITFQRTQTSSTGDVRALQPIIAKDFELFQNFVDFSLYFFPNIRPDLYERWVYLFGVCIIDLSNKWPIVSGFYKLMSCTLTVCKRYKIFEKDNSEVEREKVLYREYIIDVLARIEQYQDDLLVSGLNLILSAPLELLDVHYFVSPLQTSLEIGLTQTNIASTAVDTLDSILEYAQLQDDDQRQTVYITEITHVVPFLSNYLATDLQYDMEIDTSADFSPMKRPKKVKLKAENKRHQISEGLLGVLAQDPESAADLQIRILRFLGRLGGYNKSLLDPKRHIKDMKSYELEQNDPHLRSVKRHTEVLSWDPERHVKVRIPFTEARVDLPLDEILPRVCSLAENSLDRATKVTACELLQATLMIMIGNSAFQARGSKEPVKSPYHRLYVKIFPILLRLAINTDQIIRDIIRPLLSQLIHWLTNNAQYENAETIALLNTCIDGVCDVNGTLQDYSAECLHEFVMWSIKQTDVKRQEENPINMKSLLKRVYALASNPKPTKRLGAALTFNRIYRLFREEESLVDQFTLEILYWMLFSLKLANDDHESAGTQQQALHAIKHLQRILHKKHTLFLKQTARRRPIPNLEKADLSTFIDFTFTQISEKQIKYAKKNLEIFLEFLPYTSKSTPSWLQQQLKKDPDYLIQTVEVPRLEDIKLLRSQEHELVELLGCCENLTAILTTYTWLLEADVAAVDQLLDHPKFKLLSTLQDVVSASGASIAYTLKESVLSASTLRRKQGRSLREFIAAVIYFVLELTKRGRPPFIDDELWTPPFQRIFGQFLYGTIFQTSIFQRNSEIEDILYRGKALAAENIGVRLLVALKEQGYTDSLDTCCHLLAGALFSEDSPLYSMLSDKDASVPGIQDLLQGFVMLQKHELMDKLIDIVAAETKPKLPFSTPESMFRILYDLFKIISGTKSPDQKMIATKLISVCLMSSEAIRLMDDLIEWMSQKNAVYIEYSQPINHFLSKQFEHVASIFIDQVEKPQVQELIVGTVQYHCQSSNNRMETSDFFWKLICMRPLWKKIQVQWTNSKNHLMLARLLSKLSSLQAYIPNDLQTSDHLDIIFQCFQYFLDSKIPLRMKNEAFPSLPLFLRFDSFSSKIEPKLKSMCANEFPRLSSDLDKASVLYVEYIECLDLLIRAMVESKSRMVFELLLTVIFQDDKHSHSTALYDGVANYCAKLDPQEFTITASVCFQYFLDKTKDLRFRKNAVKAILGPMLRQVPQGHVIAFYESHVTTIMDILKAEVASHQLDIPLDTIEEKTCCYNLMQISFFTPEQVHTTKSSISVKWEKSQNANGEGRQMTIDLIRFGHKMRGQMPIRSFQNELKKSVLQCQQYAYNAISAAIVCTQKSEKFFIGFCFKEKPEERIWTNLLDVTTAVQLPIEFNRPPIRAKLIDLKTKAWVGGEKKQSVRYLSSQYLMGSSLSQPATLSDIQLVQKTENKESEMEQKQDTVTLAVSNEESTLDLELDFFNKHACMATILRMIIKLQIEIIPPSQSESEKLPLWMSELHKSFTSMGNELNVRLFISKIIVNWPVAFENYTKHWIKPLMNLVMEGKEYGEPMNYHVQDLCYIIVSWIPSVPFTSNREDKMLIFSFMSYLMRHAHHDNRTVLRTNLDIIKLSFEQWKELIIVPTRVIFESIGNPELSTKEKVTGLQLCGIALAHEMLPTARAPETSSMEPSDGEFYTSIVHRVDAKEQELFAVAAEVAGWVLALMRKKDCLNIEFEQALIQKLNRIAQVNESKLLICLYKLQINDRIICQPFSNKVLDILPRQNGKLRGYALRVLACNANEIEQLFESMVFKNMWKTLQQRDEFNQIAMLDMLEKIAPTIEQSRIDSILSLLTQTFVAHPSTSCREIYYRILQDFYQVAKNDPIILQRIKISLLRGLVDSSDSIRVGAATFWRSQYPSSDIFETVKFLLSDMYEPEVEEVYLQYSNWMILDASKSSFDYNKPMFEQPLPNAKFDENYAQINTSWRANSSMAPLFVASFENPNPYGGEEQSPILRATQEALEFTPTIADDYRNSQMVSSQSSMLFDYAGSNASMIMDTVMTESQRDIDEVRSQAYSQRDANGKLRNRRRFIKQQNYAASKFFRNREASKKRSMTQYQTYQNEAKEYKVNLYRRYRVGDLPDIQILYQDLILPLQSLGQKDIEIARILYRMLVISIADASAERPPSMMEETASLRQQILQQLHSMLQRTTLHYPPAINSFLRIFYDMDGLELSPTLIKSVSEASFNEQTGITLIEKQLQTQTSPERDSKRSKTDKKASLQPYSKDQWIQLASLYNSINEHEIFATLYSENIASKQPATVAIDAESEGDYLLASGMLLDLIEQCNEEVGYTESNIWEQERLRCLEKMALWDDLALNVMVEVEDDVELLWDTGTHRYYFDFFMKCFSKLPGGIQKQDQEFNPWTETSPNPLATLLHKAMETPNRIQYLISNYSPELAALHFQKNDMDRARYYVRQSYRQLISSLSSLNPLATNSKYLRLQGIQKIVEMDDFLNILHKNVPDGSTTGVWQQMLMMEHRYPSPEADTMDIWDDLMITRSSILDNLALVKEHNMDELEQRSRQLQKTMHIKMADVASGQRNFVVATNALRKAKRFHIDDTEQLNSALNISLGKLSITSNDAKKASLLDRMLNNVFSSTAISNVSIKKQMDYNLIAAQVLESAIIFLRSSNEGDKLLQLSKTSKWMHQLNIKNQSIDTALQTLCDGAYDFVNKALKTVSHLPNESAHCIFQLAKYCDRILRSTADSSLKPISFDHLSYAHTVIDGVFKAMDLGVKEATHIFPRLLELIEEYPATREHFKTCSKEFSGIWILLPWLPQLVAVLDKAIAPSVNPLVKSIAKSYPKALYYPMAISKEHYKFDDSQGGKRQSQQVEMIWNAVSSPLMNDFVTELRRLTNPEHIVKDFIDYAMSLMDNPSRDTRRILGAFNDMNQLLLDLRNNRLGPIPKAFALKHASQLYSFCGRDGSKLTGMTSKEFRKLIKYYQSDIQNQKLPGAPELLKSYSPWLANFHYANFAEDIEIPGQYTGNRKPHPSQHAKISNFDDRVLVMSSLRKPKRIRIYGTDEKEYLFLVKGGEDLRLDQRIQQLFSVMNTIISGNAFCLRQGIFLTTYKVIPMTGSIGVIEWLDNTKPIRACLEERPARKNQMVRLQEAYRSWVSSFKGETMGYRALLQAPRDTVVKQFDMFTSTLPSNVLRDSIYSLAASPEAFLAIRQDFAYSLAAINVGGYILGIGDRHLENFLIDRKSGRLISIDFGHAFGSATELLPVPELIPFRLTRQMIGFLEPLGVAGLLRVPMINVLEALRNNQDLLLNVMDIFVKEPLMDWKKIAIKRGKEQSK